MRRIGFIEGSQQAERFCDYLVSRGIHASPEPDPEDSDRYAVWVRDEHLVSDAREELALFHAEPGNEKYNAASKAKVIRAKEAAENRRRLKNIKKLSASRSTTRGTPLTLAMVVVCVVVGLLTGFGRPRGTLEQSVYQGLTFVRFQDYVEDGDSFGAIRDGQVWRILTPTLLHANIGHLAMNMFVLFVLGTAIERYHGIGFMAALLLFTALAASLVQVFWPPGNGGGPLFVGASGVTYGLVGFLLARPQFDPQYPIRIPPMFQVLTLGFLVAGIMGIVPGIANGGHVGGLAAGMLCAAAVPGSNVFRGRR